MSIFDVAKWCESDIKHCGKDLDYSLTDNDIENIIETLGQNFDGQYGINWDTIGDAIRENMEGEK